MATPTSHLLNQSYVAAAAVQPKPEDANRLLTRYIFVPFKTSGKLSSYYKSLYGLPFGLRQGVLEKISRFVRPEIDDAAVKNVPMNQWGEYVPTSPGVQELKEDVRVPADVVAAILRAHNPEYVSNGAENNGIMEVVALRGLEDRLIHEQIQGYFLPEIYQTAREQVARLESALAGNGLTKLYRDVGETLLAATHTAITYGMGKYASLQASVEEYGRTGKTGKRKLSAFDKRLCAWLEVPEPKLQSMLKQFQEARREGAATAEPVIPFTQCADCGNKINLINGKVPPRGCLACGWNPNAVVEAVSQTPVSVADQEEFDLSTGGAKRRTLEERQMEARERNRK